MNISDNDDYRERNEGIKSHRDQFSLEILIFEKFYECVTVPTEPYLSYLLNDSHSLHVRWYDIVIFHTIFRLERDMRNTNVTIPHLYCLRTCHFPFCQSVMFDLPPKCSAMNDE